MEKKLSDSSVEATLLSIKEKRKELQASLVKFVPVTNMNLELFGKRYNLHVCDVNELTFLLRFLSNIYIPSEQFSDNLEISGFRVSFWILDLSNKIHFLETTKKLAQLMTTEQKLVAMYTPDKKNELEFANILNTLENI